MMPWSHNKKASVGGFTLFFLLSWGCVRVCDLTLPLQQQVSRRSNNSRLRRGLLGDVSSIFLSYAFCTRSLMKANDAKAFIRGKMNSAFSFFFSFGHSLYSFFFMVAFIKCNFIVYHIRNLLIILYLLFC